MTKWIYHFVQVTVQPFKAGSELMKDHLNDFDLTDKDYTHPDVTEWLEENERNNKAMENDSFAWIRYDFEPEYKLLQDIWGFSFQIIGGPFFNGYNDSPLTFDFNESGAENVIYQNDLEMFKRHAIDLMEQHNETHRTKADHVSFMAMYQWTAWHDSYNNEYDTECYLVGIMTRDKLEAIADGFKK